MISKDLYDNLDDILDELGDYIRATYGEHYVGETEIQNIDEWEANGSVVTTSRDTASKYLKRFGKKDGKNKKDLLKALHYILIMYAKEFPSKEKVVLKFVDSEGIAAGKYKLVPPMTAPYGVSSPGDFR